MQRFNGNDAAYEEALRGYLAFLDSRKGQASVIFSDKVYASDAALTYARLSALALKRGANEEASQYLARASALCPQLGWSECSAERIAAMALRLDSRRPSESALRGDANVAQPSVAANAQQPARH